MDSRTSSSLSKIFPSGSRVPSHLAGASYRMLFAGTHEGHVSHTWGKSMPPGTICGGRPFVSNKELEFPVRVTRRVAGSAISAWCFGVRDFMDSFVNMFVHHPVERWWCRANSLGSREAEEVLQSK